MKTEYRSYPKVRYSRIIATQEKSTGNESVGTMWNETKTFSDDTPIREIMDWAAQCDGKLIITWDESTEAKLNQ